MVRGEAGLTRKKITSGHRSTQPHFQVRNQFLIWTGSPIRYSHVKLFDVANKGHYYIVNSLRTWRYPIGDPVQIKNWFLTWKWVCVLLWPEVIFFLVNPASPRAISIDKKKISSEPQGKLPLEQLDLHSCKSVRSLSKQGQIQPHCHSGVSSLSR